MSTFEKKAYAAQPPRRTPPQWWFLWDSEDDYLYVTCDHERLAGIPMQAIAEIVDRWRATVRESET